MLWILRCEFPNETSSASQGYLFLVLQKMQLVTKALAAAAKNKVRRGSAEETGGACEDTS